MEAHPRGRGEFRAPGEMGPTALRDFHGLAGVYPAAGTIQPMPLTPQQKAKLKLRAPVPSGDQTPEAALNLAVSQVMYVAQTFMDMDDLKAADVRAELERLTRA